MAQWVGKLVIYIAKKSSVDPTNPLTQDTARFIIDLVKEVLF